MVRKGRKQRADFGGPWTFPSKSRNSKHLRVCGPCSEKTAECDSHQVGLVVAMSQLSFIYKDGQWADTVKDHSSLASG